MGREVRRVPPNWEHPRYVAGQYKGEYRPCYDEDYDTAARNWMEGFKQWQEGKYPHQLEGYYWDCEGMPPEEETYRPAFTEEPIWYQLYETVSEGTPVSPSFATLEELARYLSENGDFGYQYGQQKGWSYNDHKPTYEQALAMVKSGWAPSIVVVDGRILNPYEASVALHGEE